MSRNPYLQVALTYVYHTLSSARTAFLILAGFIVLAVTLMLMTTVAKHPEFFVIVSYLMFRPIVLHVKEQFANSRSHLLPNFHDPHIAIATIAVFAFALVLPAIFTLAAGLHSFGLGGLTVFFLSIVLWSEMLDSVWLRFCSGFAWVAVCVHPGRAFLRQLVSGQFEVCAVALLIAGLATVLLGGIRLFRLNEEMSGYRCRYQKGWAWDERTIKENDANEQSLFPSLNNWFKERRAVRLVKHARRAHTSPWSRVCRWQGEMISGLSILSWSIGVVLYLQFLSRQDTIPLDLLFVMLTFLPGGFLLTTLARQNRTLSNGVLLPVRRATFVQQIGMASLLSQLSFWGAISSTAILWWLMANHQRPPFVVIASLLIMSGMIQLFFFGVGIWLAACGSLFVGVLVGGAAVLVPIVLMSMSEQRLLTEWSSSMLLVMASLVAVGMAFAYNAYRRWLVADFD